MLSSSHSPCCEALPEERSAGDPHATFCGNRWQATATDDPVPGWATARGYPTVFALFSAHQQSGIQITPTTSHSLWLGEKMDDELTVLGMLQLE